MAQCRIEIEHVNDIWVAEIEIGGMIARRVTLRTPTIEEMLDQVWAKYRELIPDETPRPPPIVSAPLAPVAMAEPMKRLTPGELTQAWEAGERAQREAQQAPMLPAGVAVTAEDHERQGAVSEAHPAPRRGRPPRAR